MQSHVPLLEGVMVEFKYSTLLAHYSGRLLAPGAHRLGRTKDIYPTADSTLSPGPCITSGHLQEVDVNTVLHNLPGACLRRP